MAGFELIETIACPPREVFAFITNPANASKISGSITGSEKLTSGPAGVGTRYRETRIMNGKEEQAELEVVAFEPGRRYAVQNVTQGVTSTYTYSLSPADGGTLIELACEVAARGVRKLIVPMVVSVLKKEDGGHLKRLKEVMES